MDPHTLIAKKEFSENQGNYLVAEEITIKSEPVIVSETINRTFAEVKSEPVLTADIELEDVIEPEDILEPVIVYNTITKTFGDAKIEPTTREPIEPKWKCWKLEIWKLLEIGNCWKFSLK